MAARPRLRGKSTSDSEASLKPPTLVAIGASPSETEALRSANEALQTVNNELRVRLEAVSRANADLQGLMAATDVSERRRIEEALRESEERLRRENQLVELSHAAIFSWEVDGVINQWNRGSARLFGHDREAAMGRRPRDLLQTEVVGGTFEAMIETLRRTGHWSGELRQLTRDGRRITVEADLEIVDVDGRLIVLESSHDVTDRLNWERRQEMMLSELSHRVKNTLAVVQSFASQSIRSAATPEEFTERFEGRLAALARSHQLLTDPWKGAEIEALAREQLQPYLGGNAGKLRLEGPPVSLPPDLAVPLGLVLHELATNAVKYGAWSSPNGRVELSWAEVDSDPGRTLTIDWVEKDGARIAEPTRTGFGSRLIQNGLPNAHVRREFKPDGATCAIVLRVPEESAP